MERNIKFIATDMDGTFLDDNKEYPVEFYDIFKQLKEKGIHFCAASGRQYQKLKENFGPIADEMMFIAENGSIVVDGTEVIYLNTMSDEDYTSLIKLLENDKRIVFACCGQSAAYMLSKDINQKYEFEKYYASIKVIDSFDEIKEPIFKIAILDSQYKAYEVYNQYAPYIPSHIRAVVSGAEWVDIQNASINKGIAIEVILKHFNLTKDEAMCFGDQMNDYAMMTSVTYSYAMENAVDDIKKVAYAICPSNQEYGVIQTIKELLK